MIAIYSSFGNFCFNLAPTPLSVLARLISRADQVYSFIDGVFAGAFGETLTRLEKILN